MKVEVAYALKDRQTIIVLNTASECTIEQAIEQSGILSQYPEIDISINKVGIFGKLATLRTPLREHDRVEIYRPLIADPKEVRKQRAKAGKTMRKTPINEQK